MSAPWIVALCFALFAGLHLALGLPPLRPRLIARLGEPRFVALFSGLAGLSLLLLAGALYRYGALGPPMPVLSEGLRWALGALALLGWLCAMASFDGYTRSPMAVLRTHYGPPAGFQVITRHGFFVGFAIYTAAHALLVPTVAQAVHFGGFALLSLIGVVWQDRKLLHRHGPAYAAYMAQTSIVPFVAVLRGRQRLSMPQAAQCWRPIALTLLPVLLHPWLSMANGAWLAGLLGIGGIALAARRWVASGERAASR
ncbi:MAG: hypothetical protein MUE46_11980 [Xanthomonadales bacterium]|jgi:uncharacterized membrane protein|nr:hypothetical protein [Xanthomonadales bacterium]